MPLIELFIFLSFAASYCIRVLLFEERSSHHGPGKNHDIRIKRFDTHGEYYDAPQTLLDRIRRWTPMNPYLVSGNDWVVDPEKMEVWECPKCLSPYVACAVTLPVMLFYGQWQHIPLMWISVTGGSYLIYSVIERLQTYQAEAVLSEDV